MTKQIEILLTLPEDWWTKFSAFCTKHYGAEKEGQVLITFAEERMFEIMVQERYLNMPRKELSTADGGKYYVSTSRTGIRSDKTDTVEVNKVSNAKNK